MIWVEDNYDRWERHDAEQQRILNNLPKCTECGEPIQQEDALYINGGFICDNCISDMRMELMHE